MESHSTSSSLIHHPSSLFPRPSSLKRGSALLIVLGMMAFMVVSAVAFSMFMRQSRLPSSFLRQRLTASQLVKAGLAGAMQRIDAAIGDNPYPGIGTVGNRNYWRNRVLWESSNTGSDQMDEEDLDYDTVSTLTLEALAYIPPPLVNTVRYWSKLTPTASWSSLGYDAGRYAFTAVNVSDYFDINRLCADVMRDSSPENRISMGYLFENGKHSGPGDVSPTDFDKFIGKVTNDVFKTRFVSLADYNIALGSGQYGDVGFESPFWNYLDSGKRPGDGTFYGSFADLAKQQKFVTGSWYPGLMDGDAADLYLTDAEAQPLYNLGKGLDPLMKDAGAGFNAIKRHLNLAERAALRDYIDEDNVPTSLALPTMELAPMLTGLQIMPLAVSVPKIVQADEVKKEVAPQKGEGKRTEVQRVWALDSLGELKLMFGGSAVYPFKRKFATAELGEPTSFDVQVLVKAFLSKESQALTATRIAGGSLRPGGTGDWTTRPHDMNTGIFTCLSKGKINVTAGQTESETLCTWSSDPITLQLGGGDLKRIYGIKYIEVTDKDTGATEIKDVTPDTSLMTGKALMLRDAAGNVHPATELVTGFENLKVNFMVWIRVLNGNDTVDMVPAMIADDFIYNGMPKPGVSTDLLGEQTKEPVMPVDGPLITLNQESFKAGGEPANFDAAYDGGKGLKVYCNDPRYNWAPEDWYWAGDDATISGQDWLTKVKALVKENNTSSDDMPRDIFQFVSNADYLQSMGEIQFLPLVRTRYSDFTENNPISSSFHGNSARYDGKAFSERTGFDQLANRNFMWRTRFAFGHRADTSNEVEADPYDWGVYDSRGGVAVSPYADKDLMMAALANTPYDYSVASADNNLTLANGRKYTFGPGGSEAQVEWEELQIVADEIKKAVGTSTDWEDVLFIDRAKTAQWWDQVNEGPFGADFGDNFHDVDRKFLYSYWRSCFANNQQLFLVFVRAEPAVMGGSSAGHTPSQLGARAVALVWREPESSISDESSDEGASSHPHRMRILFYHQFE